MSRIGFSMMTGERGHYRAAFKLASQLVDRGHDVLFFGLEDDEEYTTRAGYEYYTYGRDIFPRGSFRVDLAPTPAKLVDHMRRRRELMRRMKTMDLVATARSMDLLLGDGLDPYALAFYLGMGVRCAALQTSLVLWNRAVPPLETPHLPPVGGFSHERLRLMWGLHRLRRRVHPMFLLQDVLLAWFGGSDAKVLELYGIRGHATLASMTESLPNLIAIPQAFDFPHSPRETHFFGDPLTSPSDPDDRFDWSQIPDDRALIYASMGSRDNVLREPKLFYAKLMKAVEGRPDRFLVIATGDSFDIRCFDPLPGNVLLLNWAPQWNLIERASVVISHGGLNSIKECIHAGVPMIVTPIMRDQPGNAARVEYHGLGLRLSPRCSAAEMGTAIDTVLRGAHRARVKAMSQVFRDAEGMLADAVERLLGHQSITRAAS
jgi:zeaxanthin glucosyltransferase